MHILNILYLAVLPAVFAQLNKLAKAKGLKYFGTATDNPELTDTTYLSILTNTSQFGQITPGNTQKWVYTEPTQNVFDFTEGDVITSLAESDGQILRCHNLCWYNELPTWITSGTWTNATLIAALQNHIANEVTHYKGQCYAWDVVNEAFNDDGSYRVDVFYSTIGPEYIPIAFETAALYDPSVKLYYNDYNIESTGAHATAVLNLVSSLKARGIKIDGVGLQGHLIVGETPSQATLEAQLKAFTALGVEVAYTEVDIRFTSLPPTTAGLAQQSADYVSVVNACLNVADCVGITIWDFTDKYSWIPSTFSGEGDACLWYANYTVHPAYYAVVSALGGSVATSTSTVVSSTTTTILSITTTTSTTLSKSTTKASTTMTTTKTKTSTSSSATSTSTALAGLWGQCGGQAPYYTGPLACVSPYICVYQNPYYSQCLAS